MKTLIIITLGLLSFSAMALPERYTELLDYVQEAPDQGDTGTCLFVASTGAMELIANKHHNITNPLPFGKYDLAESFLIHAPATVTKGKYMWEVPVLKFNNGFGINVNDWPYDPWDDTDTSSEVWNYRSWENLPKVKLPPVETIPLFVIGTRWSTNVLTDEHLTKIKDALVTHRSPVMVNINDSGYWHVILIVGYDDTVPGSCFEITPEECGERKGAFYVRDSFGIPFELRDYDWGKIKINAAFVVKEKK
jgi:hypothetical protein